MIFITFMIIVGWWPLQTRLNKKKKTPHYKNTSTQGGSLDGGLRRHTSSEAWQKFSALAFCNIILFSRELTLEKSCREQGDEGWCLCGFRQRAFQRLVESRKLTPRLTWLYRV